MFIQPNKQAGIPLYSQITEQLKEMILQKELPGGAKLPSERTMATFQIIKTFSDQDILDETMKEYR